VFSGRREVAMRAFLPFLLVACGGPGSTPSTGPVDEGPPADPDVDTWVPDTFPPSDPRRVVFFGDSITAGYGISDPGDVYTALMLANRDRRWPDQVGDDLAARFPALDDVLDVSVPGATTGTVVADQLPDVEAAWGPVVEGEVLVVGTIGGNDLTEAIFNGRDLDQATDDVLANLETITRFFHDPVRFPGGAHVAITNVYEPSDGAGQVDECFFGLDLSGVIPAFDGLIDDSRAQAERDGWAWVDLRGHFRGHGFHFDDEGDWYEPEDPTLWFQADCIHPNERGHHEIRRLFMAAFAGEPLLLEP
jgi:lysophospholipase L1-like esterase